MNGFRKRMPEAQKLRSLAKSTGSLLFCGLRVFQVEPVVPAWGAVRHLNVVLPNRPSVSHTLHVKESHVVSEQETKAMLRRQEEKGREGGTTEMEFFIFLILAAM